MSRVGDYQAVYIGIETPGRYLARARFSERYRARLRATWYPVGYWACRRYLRRYPPMCVLGWVWGFPIRPRSRPGYRAFLHSTTDPPRRSSSEVKTPSIYRRGNGAARRGPACAPARRHAGVRINPAVRNNDFCIFPQAAICRPDDTPRIGCGAFRPTASMGRTQRAPGIGEATSPPMLPFRPVDPGRRMIETVPYLPFPGTPARAPVNRPPNRNFGPVGPVGGVQGAWPVYRVHVTWGAPEPTYAGNTPTLTAYRRAWIHAGADINAAGRYARSGGVY